MRFLPSRIAALALAVAVASLDGFAIAAGGASCAPLEQRVPNAKDQRPAFAGQTRACAIASSVAFDVVVLAKGLEKPWAVEPLPDGDLLVTEKAGRLRIVSASGQVGQPIAGVPSALASLTKGGLNAVTRSLAMEFAKGGVRVNAVSPGIINTPMHAPETHAALSALHPVGRMGEIRDIVEAVLYLESASFVTGEIVHVDGGQSAGRW